MKNNYMKKISEEEVRRMKENNQKKFVEIIRPPEPPIAINKISKAEVERIKSKNKIEGKKFIDNFRTSIKNFTEPKTKKPRI